MTLEPPTPPLVDSRPSLSSSPGKATLPSALLYVAHRIARREGDPHERRERAQRIKRDILVARRLRGGLALALTHAWGEPVD